MNWKPITKSLDEIINILSDGMMKGDNKIKQMRCVFSTDDSNMIHSLSAFDFIDLDPPKDTIKKITLYQLIDQKSIS